MITTKVVVGGGTLDVALPSAETSPDKTNKPSSLGIGSGERNPGKIKDPVVTLFRAAQLAMLPNSEQAPLVSRERGSEQEVLSARDFGDTKVTSVSPTCGAMGTSRTPNRGWLGGEVVCQGWCVLVMGRNGLGDEPTDFL